MCRITSRPECMEGLVGRLRTEGTVSDSVGPVYSFGPSPAETGGPRRPLSTPLRPVDRGVLVPGPRRVTRGLGVCTHGFSSGLGTATQCDRWSSWTRHNNMFST